MYMRTARVLSEYVVFAQEVGYSLKGRVVEYTAPVPDPNQRYGWEVSHYYKPSKDAASVYRPSVTLAKSPTEAEQMMLGYLGSFTGIDVAVNEYY